ncbi:MAG: hypothetical protein HQL32_17820, partial [Planctomycetes bacterium]|nr:hypothetical protein [Planctomycetota bacterium]
MSYQSVDSDTEIGGHSTILVDSLSGNTTITLPYAGNVEGRVYTIKKTSAENSVWISGGGNLVPTGLAESTKGALKICSTGEKWMVLSSYEAMDTVAPENMIAWYKLDETSGNTIYDATDNGNDGTAENFAAENIGSQGVFDKALEFDGSDDKVTFNDIDAMDQAQQLTFSCWFKQDVLDQKGRIMSKASYEILIWDNGMMYFGFNRNGPGDLDRGYFDYSTACSAGQWHHVVHRFDGTQTGNDNRLQA